MRTTNDKEYEEWLDHIPEIPFFKLGKGVSIRVIPPFGGALVRFLVFKEGREDRISVYLDVDESLGLFGGPYWEIYPAADGGTERFSMKDIDALIKGIKEALS